MNEEITEIELTEQSLESFIYEIRGQRVMLDSNLARIYGYSTRDFNNQIKHNIERFENDFRFQLTKEEVEQLLRWKKSTARIWNTTNKGGRTSLPYAFTEQGIYMLMTVLRGELAVKQSKALIRLFKCMKDYIVASNNLLASRDILELTNQVYKNTKGIETLKRKGAVMDKKLTKVMDNFIDPSTYKSFLILDGQKIEADIAYQTIYSLAKQTIYIIDDYINLKTLYLLRGIKSGVKVTIVSDNIAKDKVSLEDIESFKKECSIDLLLVPSNKRFHDRFIVVDDGSESQVVYHCGGSSKDAGKRITSIHTINSDNLITILTNSLDEKN